MTLVDEFTLIFGLRVFHKTEGAQRVDSFDLRASNPDGWVFLPVMLTYTIWHLPESTPMDANAQ